MASFRISPPRALALAAALLALLGLGFFVAAREWQRADKGAEEKGVLADVLSRALSTPRTEVSIGGIDGALSSDATVRDLKISDRDGVWLAVNRIRIVWRRLALLQRRLEIDKLDIDQMNVARKPIPAESPVPGEEQPLLPELPLRVDIKQFSLARVDFGQPVLGVASSFSTGGNATLGPPAEGLQLFLDAQRLDRPAALNVRLNLVPDSQHLDLNVNLDEPAGGILSHLANIPDRPPIKLSIIGSGALDAFNAKLAFDAGQGVGARGDASLNREGAGRRLGLDLAAEVSGLLPQMAAPVFAGTTRLSGNVFFGDDSAIVIPGVELTAAAARLDVTGGLSAAQIADIRFSAKNVPNAESRTALKDAEIRRLAFDAHVTGAPDSPTIDSTLEVEDARLPSVSLSHLDARFATGVAPIDGLYGGRLTLAGSTRLDADGGFGFTDLRITGPNASARIDGAATPKLTDFSALVTIPELSKADKRATGRGEIVAHVTGTLSLPDATAKISIRDAALLGRPIPRLDVQADATNLRGALDAHVSLDGEIDRKPARGSLHIARPAAGGAVLDGVDVSIGSVSAQGGVALDAANFAAGQFALHARDLDDLSPLALQKLSGGIDADVTLTHADARQDAAIKANGQRIEAFGVSLDKLAADLALTDVYHRPVIAGSLAVDEARIGGETVSRVRLNAEGGVDASDITLTATARGRNLDARARVVPADPIRIEITKFDATRGRSRIGLAGPATVVFKDGGADLRNLSLSLSGGRLTIEGRAGSKLDLKAIARGIPLSAADILAPDLGLSGSLDGEATVTGPLAAPAGAYRFKIDKLAAPQTRTIGLPLIDVDATGRFEGTRTTLEASLAAGQAGRLKISGGAPLAAEGALDLAIKGNLDAGLANRSMSTAGRRLTGSVAVDGRLGGTAPQPQAYGSITLSNGSLQDAILGIRLDAIRARLIAQGDRATIESASATTRNGGLITAGGSIRLDPTGGFPSDIRLRGQNAELVQSALATAVLGLDLHISGPLARYPRTGGGVDINSLDIAIPDRLAGSLQPLPGTRHIDPTPPAAARLAIAAKSRRSRGAPAFDAALDLTIAVPGQIRVRGRGLDAQLGGNLKLTGTLAQPKPVGAFNLVRGRLNVLTSELDLTRANLTFAGDLSPQLDFLATTQAGGASVSIAVTGNPADPQFIFRSSPDLPQDEILSRLLFGEPSGQLSPTQALALGQAAAIYSGGNDALEGLRRSLGFGAASNSDNPLNKLLGDRVSLGVHTGATPAQTGVGMSVTIYKQLKAKGAIDATGGASVGAGAEYEW